MRKLNFVLIAAMLLGLVLVSPAIAKKPLTTLTMDEVATQPINGLDVSGVSFEFYVDDVPSTDAHINDFGPGRMLHVQDPSIEGNTSGKIVMVFDKPTTEVAFGIALNTMYDLEDVINVSLYRPGKGLLRETVDVDAHPEILWTEAQYDYSGPAVKTVEITFQSRPAYRFAMDNLTFHMHPAAGK